MIMTEQRLHELFVLNLTLQLFDGVATWHGFGIWGEGNPVLKLVMAQVGVGTAIVLFKAKACAFLIVLRRCWYHPGAYTALASLAMLYAGLSFVPWMSRIVSLLRA